VTQDYLVEDPLAALRPTARMIIETTRRLLVERGYGDLSLETIAKECDLNKTAVRYYFGNKAGLMEAVIDSYVHDNSAFIVDFSDAETRRQRIHAFLDAKRTRVSEHSDLQLAFFELLPNVLRDESHTERLVIMYEWVIKVYVDFFGGNGSSDDPRLRALAQLLISVVDGLSVQYAIDSERFPIDEAYALLESMLSRWLEAEGLLAHRETGPTA